MVCMPGMEGGGVGSVQGAEGGSTRSPAFSHEYHVRPHSLSWWICFYQVSRLKAEDWSRLQSREVNSCLIYREDPRKRPDCLNVSYMSTLRVKCQVVDGRGCLGRSGGEPSQLPSQRYMVK